MTIVGGLANLKYIQNRIVSYKMMGPEPIVMNGDIVWGRDEKAWNKLVFGVKKTL